ncbi:sensor histidine kinase [Xanthocytophaga flava]|uniref:sensor histidine kinase n=1 Tax=Xanthocytophaga flava TaxID=3048013 RepID=UPI0028D57DEC|nr:histidine kinase [Xanthocytophaga flavus]MDJ1472454.1 histidine kinase [Xanthocytophaga flavus]
MIQAGLHPGFFSKAEWRYHLLMMPVLFPLGNYYLIGPSYFQQPSLFLIGTLLVFILYWFSISILTVAVRKVLAYWSEKEQVWIRTSFVFLVVGILTFFLAFFDVWIYSLFHQTGVKFSWKTVCPILILGGVFDFFLCTAVLLFNSNLIWKSNTPTNSASWLALANPALTRLGISPLGWGFHGLAVLVFIPIANHLIIGPRYWTNGLLLALGSAVVTLLYIPIAALLTLSVRLAIYCYPSLHCTVLRIGFMLLLTGIVSSISAIGSVWVLSKIDILDVRFSHDNIYTLILLGLIFDLLFCIAHGYFYALSMWQKQQVEIEKLKKEKLQHQFDTLKGQLNPHFLFNSLNSLSSLISEDTQQAEHFVDDLAKVYRYLLQTGRSSQPDGEHSELVTLQTELNFIASYISLLKTRYGKSLLIEQHIAEAYKNRTLPPLTLQTLIDNAMKHNSMLPGRPLTICITTSDPGHLRVRNNIQRKTMRLETGQSGLANLAAKYQLVCKSEPQIIENDQYFEVIVPLLESNR